MHAATPRRPILALATVIALVGVGCGNDADTGDAPATEETQTPMDGETMTDDMGDETMTDDMDDETMTDDMDDETMGEDMTDETTGEDMDG